MLAYLILSILLSIIWSTSVGGQYLVSSFAGRISGDRGNGGLAKQAEPIFPRVVYIDTNNDIYLTEMYCIRRISRSDGTITNFAGGGSQTADGVEFSLILMSNVCGITGDTAGNIYYSSVDDCTVRMLSASTHQVSTVAGVRGACGFNGDDRPATTAHLQKPLNIFYFAPTQNLFVVDLANNRIRLVDMADPNRLIHTFAGNGTIGLPGDGPASSAYLNSPYDIWVSTTGTAYIAEAGGCRIRTVTNSMITTVVGIQGTCAFSPSATAPAIAPINSAVAMCGDSAGRVYFAQYTSAVNGNAVWSYLQNGIIRPVAGLVNATVVAHKANALSIRVFYPGGCKVDSANNLIFTDPVALVVMNISTPTTNPMTNVLMGYVSNVIMPASSAVLGAVYGIWSHPSTDDLFLADYDQHRVNRVDARTNTIQIYAGSAQAGKCSANSFATACQLNHPFGLTGNTLGELYIADSDNHKIRKVDALGIITTVAGNENNCQAVVATSATSTPLCFPTAIEFDLESGMLYIADHQSVIRAVSKFGACSTIIGIEGQSGSTFQISNSQSARISKVYQMHIATIGDNVLYIADTGNRALRRSNLGSKPFTTVANSSTVFSSVTTPFNPYGVCGAGSTVFAFSNATFGIVLDSAAPTSVSVVAGNGQYGIGIEDSDALGGPMLSGRVCSVNAHGNVFYAEYSAEMRRTRIRKMDSLAPTSQPSRQPSTRPSRQPSAQPSRQPTAQPSAYPTVTAYSHALVNTYAGNLTGMLGDSERALTATLSSPSAVYVDSTGDVYVTETYRIRRVRGDKITTYARQDATSVAGEYTHRLNTSFAFMSGLTGDPSGNLYYAELYACRVRVISAQSGLIHTIAGTNNCMHTDGSGSGGPVTLSNPMAVAYHPDNLLFISEQYYIHVFNLTSMTMTSRQLGQVDGSMATFVIETQALIPMAKSMWVNALGDVYIAEAAKCRILVLNHGSAYLHTVVGNATCALTADSIPSPSSICGDNNGNLFFFAKSVMSNGGAYYRISNGVVSVVAGDPSSNLLASDVPAADIAIIQSGGCEVHPVTGELLFTSMMDGMLWKVLTPSSPDQIYSMVGFVGNMVQPAESVALKAVRGIWNDPFTNDLYISETTKHRVLRIDDNQLLSVFAGTSSPGRSQDDLPATTSSLWNPFGAVGGAQSIFIADLTNNRVVRVDLATRLMTTVAGGEELGCSMPYYDEDTSGGISDTNVLCAPLALTYDAADDMLYVATMQNVVFRVNINDQMNVEIVAGTGNPGDSFMVTGGPAFAIDLPVMSAIWLDGERNIYMTDVLRQAVYKLSRANAEPSSMFNIEVIADWRSLDTMGNAVSDTLRGMCGDSQTGDFYFFSNGQGIGYKGSNIGSPLFTPYIGHYQYDIGGEYVDSLQSPMLEGVACSVGKYLYYVEYDAAHDLSRVRRVTTDLYPTSQPSSQPTELLVTSHYYVKTVVGVQTGRGDGSPSQAALLVAPKGIYIDSAQNQYIAETNYIRKIDTSGRITTIAGGGVTFAAVRATSSLIVSAFGITGDNEGNIYFSDSELCAVRVIHPDGTIATVAGMVGDCEGEDLGIVSTTYDPLAISLARPRGIHYSKADGNLYVVVSNCAVYAINLAGDMTVVAGTGECSANINPVSSGVASTNELYNASFVWTDGNGRLLIADRKAIWAADITFNSIALLAGDCSEGRCLDDVVAVCGDRVSNRIYAIEKGLMTTNILIFTALSLGAYDMQRANLTGYMAGSNIPLSNFTFGSAFACEVDQHGALIVTDMVGNAVWNISAPVTMESTVASVVGYVGGVHIPVEHSRIFSNAISGLWTNTNAALFFVESARHVVHKLDASLSIFAGMGKALFPKVDNVPATMGSLYSPKGVVGDQQGNIYIAEANAVRKVDGVTNMISTIAGNGLPCTGIWSYLGPASNLSLCSLTAITLIGDDLYFVDSRIIRRLHLPTLVLSPAVGTGLVQSGPPILATMPPLALKFPSGPSTVNTLFSDAQGILYYLDFASSGIYVVVRAVNFITNEASVYAGQHSGSTTENIPAITALIGKNGACSDRSGNIYISSGSKVRVISAASEGKLIRTIIGNNGAGIGGENVVGLKSPVLSAASCTVDQQDNLYYVESATFSATATGSGNGYRIRKAAIIVAPSSQPSSQPSSMPSFYPEGEDKMIDTYAGLPNYKQNLRGDGDIALAATLQSPKGIHVDTANNYYIAEEHYIRRIDRTTGLISTFAGGGVDASGNNIPATLAYITSAYGIAGDESGNIYYTDKCSIRFVDITTRLVKTIAGGQACGDGGNTGTGTSALFRSITGIFYRSTALYLVDTDNQRIKNWFSTTRTTTIMAGNGYPGYSASTNSILATLNFPNDIWVNLNGQLFIADYGNCRIRKIVGTALSSAVGNGTCVSTGDGGPASSASIGHPTAVCGDTAGDVYFSEFVSNGQQNIRRLAVDGTISKVSGSATAIRYSSIPAGDVAMGTSNGCKIDRDGNLLVTDSRTVWKINGPQIASASVASAVVGFMGGVSVPLLSMNFGLIGDIIGFDNGDILFADRANSTVIKLTSASQRVSVFAGNGTDQCANDGMIADRSSICSPYGLDKDSSGNVYIGEFSGGRVRMVNSSGLITTVAGALGLNCENSGSYAGPATHAHICNIRDIAIFGSSLFIVDQLPSIRKVDLLTNEMVTIADGTADELPYASYITSIWIDSNGSLYVNDINGHQVLVIHTQRNTIVDRYAGSEAGVWEENGLALDSVLSSPVGLCGDVDGNVYVTDSGLHKILKVKASSQRIQTVVGNGTVGKSGEYVPSLSTSLGRARACFVATDGMLYFAEDVDGVARIRRWHRFVAPTGQPSGQPSRQPTRQPSCQPSRQPSRTPTAQPSSRPSKQPSSRPSSQPSRQPTALPSGQPQSRPSGQPSRQPSTQPSLQPQLRPTTQPSMQPSVQPSTRPSTQPSSQPSVQPSGRPSLQPAARPSSQPSMQPSHQPHGHPSAQPTEQPSAQPSAQPSLQPQARPSGQPSMQPSNQPSLQPVGRPSTQPSMQPSQQPQGHPSTRPSNQPSMQPSGQPSSQPTRQPQAQPTCRPSGQPSCSPSGQPTGAPTSQPSHCPSSQPSARPTGQPSGQPSTQPSQVPSAQPSGLPTAIPSGQPSGQPSCRPSIQPSGSPTCQPSGVPSSQPSALPSSQPSSIPTAQPSTTPSVQPSQQPSSQPSQEPTGQPSEQPSASPSGQPSAQPSSQPSTKPSIQPTGMPSSQPSAVPSTQPSGKPSGQPSSFPSAQPSSAPSEQPTAMPSSQPTTQPSEQPSNCPSSQSSGMPSSQPSAFPSAQPSSQPSSSPSSEPSAQPSEQPTGSPTAQPSGVPSVQPSAVPTIRPTVQPSIQPTRLPSCQPSGSPSGQPSKQPTVQPSRAPSSQPSRSPTSCPSARPSSQPSCAPTCQPSAKPSTQPSALPSKQPSERPTAQPSCFPSAQPTVLPSQQPLAQPTSQPSVQPSVQPSSQPSVQPSSQPSAQPRSHPSSQPSGQPTMQPSRQPSTQPSSIPSSQPLSRPSGQPTNVPSSSPSACPSGFPSVQPSGAPSLQPSRQPSTRPTALPSCQPTTQPTTQPTSQPTVDASFLTLSLDLRSSQVSAGVDYLDFLAVSVEANAKVQCILNFVLTEVVSDQDMTIVRQVSSVVPASIAVTRSPSNTTQTTTSSLSASLSRLTVGTYMISMNVNGPIVPKHLAMFYGSNVIRVVAGTVPLAAPSLLSAVYSADGSYMMIAFNVETNRGNLPTKFTCSSLFSFSCAEMSSCMWVDDRNVKVQVTADAERLPTCALPRTEVALSSGASIKAKCRSSCGDTSAWPASATGVAVRIEAPATKQAPLVTINANEVTGSCAPLLLDATASSGDGGRGWTSNVTVISLANTTKLQALLLSSNFTLFPPTRIPADYLTAGSEYTFQITLCTFLGSCATTSKGVTVVSTLLPMVSIPGANVRTMKRKELLSVVVQAPMPQCGGGLVDLFAPSFVWTMARNNNSALPVGSLSKDPSRLMLSSYSLIAGSSYTITATLSSAPISASVVVKVINGDIIASISAGSSSNARIGELLQLNASASYDEDEPFGASNLLFSWSCIQTAPVLNSSCRTLFTDDLSSMVSPLLQLNVLDNELNVNAMARLTVTVQDAVSKGRAPATATVDVTLVGPISPAIVQLTSSTGSKVKINSFQSLYLMGKVDIPVHLPVGFVKWSLDSGSGSSLSSLALANTNTSILIPNITTTQLRSYLFYLPLNTPQMPAGVSLTFRLSCQMQKSDHSVVSSSASVTLMLNAPPQPGLFAISPPSGSQLSSTFLFACSNWLDEDLPLTYQFGFLSLSGAESVLRSRLQVAYADLALVAGPEYAGFYLTGFGQVFDALNANTTAHRRVQVTKPLSGSAISVADFVSKALSNSSTSTNVDGIKQATALSSYLLNIVNCSMATNCSPLNRKTCFRTPHTCGPCLPKYAGDEGDSNEACVADNLIGVLGSTNKSCPSACSGHGSCAFSSVISGQPVGVCLVGDLSCKVQCYCDLGFVGTFCSLTTSELAAKQSLREDVIVGLQRLTVVEDPDSQSLQALVGSLAAVSQQPDELTVSASRSVLNLTAYVLAHLQHTDLNSHTASGLLDAIQSSLTPKTAGSRRRLADSDESALVTQTQDVLVDYTKLVADRLAPGQRAVENIESSFRIHVSKHEGSASNVSLTLPMKAGEQGAGLQTGSVLVPHSASDIPLSIAAISMSGELFGDAIDGKPVQSNPLSLSFSSFPCSEPECFVQLVLSRQQFYNKSSDARAPAEVFNVTCKKDSFKVHEHACLSDGQVHTVTCRGKAEWLQGICPVIFQEPSCSALIGADGVDYGCTVVGYTVDNVTCSCPLMNMNLASSALAGRFAAAASNASIPSGTVSISYVSLLSTVASSFTSTVLSADNLSGKSLAKGYQALVTIGVFAGVIMMALWYSNKADEHASKIDTEKAKLAKKQNSKDTMGGAKASSLFNALTDKVLKSTGSGKVRQAKKSKKKAQRAEKRGFLEMAEDALPNVLSARSYTALIKQELKQHHRWFGVVFHYSDKFPRVLRVASLASNIIIMLFIQSMTYSLTNGDDGSCELNSTEATCLEAKSSFATGESKCYWVPADVAVYPEDIGCFYVQPNNSMKVVLFVAIFSALISTPIALLADYVISKVLGAPTAEAIVRDPRQLPPLGNSRRKPLAVIAPAPVPPAEEGVAMQSTDLVGVSSTRHVHLAQQKFVALCTALRLYLLQLQNEEDKAEFKNLWGLNDDGRFIVARKRTLLTMIGLESFEHWLHPDDLTKPTGAEAVLLAELMAVHRIYQQEAAVFKSRKLQMSVKEKNKRLLYLFQRDLLPGISGQILESKETRDNSDVKGVSRTAKRLAWVFLCLLDAGMLFYIFLFAVSQPSNRQSAWAQSFALWLVAEIFIISTCMVLLMNVAVPSLIMKDVKQIKHKLVDSLVRYHQQIATGKGESTPEADGSFNAAEYLFVSCRLAKTFSDLKTAQIIAQYQTVWPRQSYQHVVDVSQSYNRKFTALTRSASVIVLFFVSNLLTVPITIQDMVVQMVSTAVTGYTFLIHIQLFQIFPVLVIIPTLFLCVIVHFLLQSHRKHEQDSLQALLRKNQAKYAPKKASDASKDGSLPRNLVDVQDVDKGDEFVSLTTSTVHDAEELEADDESSEQGSDDEDDSQPAGSAFASAANSKRASPSEDMLSTDDAKSRGTASSMDTDSRRPSISEGEGKETGCSSANSASDSESDDMTPLHKAIPLSSVSSYQSAASKASSSSSSSGVPWDSDTDSTIYRSKRSSAHVSSDENSDSELDSSSSSDSRDDIFAPAAVRIPAPTQAHATRRQSLQQGLNFLQQAKLAAEHK